MITRAPADLEPQAMRITPDIAHVQVVRCVTDFDREVFRGIVNKSKEKPYRGYSKVNIHEDAPLFLVSADEILEFFRLTGVEPSELEMEEVAQYLSKILPSEMHEPIDELPTRPIHEVRVLREKTGGRYSYVYMTPPDFPRLMIERAYIKDVLLEYFRAKGLKQHAENQAWDEDTYRSIWLMTVTSGKRAYPFSEWLDSEESLLPQNIKLAKVIIELVEAEE